MCACREGTGFVSGADRPSTGDPALPLETKGETPELEGRAPRAIMLTLCHSFRARWWQAPAAGIHCRELVFPANNDIPALPAAPPEATDRLRTNPVNMLPVFVGPSLKPADRPLLPVRPNLEVIDHGAAKEGPLAACLWNGEAASDPNQDFTHVCSQSAQAIRSQTAWQPRSPERGEWRRWNSQTGRVRSKRDSSKGLRPRSPISNG